MLTILGNVREEVTRVKDILLKTMGVLVDDSYSPALVRRVSLFLTTLDDVHIYAGSFVKCTHGFLMTFYGMIVTYIAILHSSVVG